MAFSAGFSGNFPRIDKTEYVNWNTEEENCSNYNQIGVDIN